MTTRFTLGDPAREETLSVSRDAVRLSPAARRDLGVAVGDPVGIEAGTATVATVGEDCSSLPEGVVLAGETVVRNAEATLGASVTVEPVAPVGARSVTVAPTQSLSLAGDADALSRALAGRYLTPDDHVEARLFGGSVVVSLRVLDLDPDGPVGVTETTTVTVRESPTEGTGPVSAPLAPPDGVGGLDEERAALQRLVVRPLSDPDGYAAVGARSPAGVLVSGPRGSGKTRLLRAVAADAGLPIHEVPPDDCERRESLAAVLRAADDDAPAVVFLDALAAVAPAPDSGSGGGRGGGGMGGSPVGWLLDQVRERPEIVVVGETTHADDVDPALRRGGRFDTEIRVGPPGPEDRREILGVHAAGLRLADDIDLDALAARTHGYTGADLEALLVDAATRAADRAAETSPADTAPTRTEPAVVRPADIEAAADAVGPTTLRGVGIERPSVSYADIGGLEAAIREVVRTVEWPIRYPQLFERLTTDAPTGVLLYGPPGTGKTLLAKAVANSTDANFLAVDGPELLNRYVGASERRVRAVFDRARRTAPSVVFLDEVDALAPARGATDTGAAERVVSQLLTELDGLSARGEVAVLAATNRPESIDPALLRPGRIEKRVEVSLPDRSAREAILAIHLDGVPTADADLAALADATAGYSGSDLAGVVREAALLAVADYLGDGGLDAASLDGLVVGHDHLRRAVDRSQPSVRSGADDFDWVADR